MTHGKYPPSTPSPLYQKKNKKNTPPPPSRTVREECERVKSVFVCVEVCRVGRGRHERMKSVQWSLEHQKNNNNNDKKAKKKMLSTNFHLYGALIERKRQSGGRAKEGAWKWVTVSQDSRKKEKKAERKTACGPGQEGKLERVTGGRKPAKQQSAGWKPAATQAAATQPAVSTSAMVKETKYRAVFPLVSLEMSVVVKATSTETKAWWKPENTETNTRPKLRIVKTNNTEKCPVYFFKKKGKTQVCFSVNWIATFLFCKLFLVLPWSYFEPFWKKALLHTIKKYFGKE